MLIVQNPLTDGFDVFNIKGVNNVFFNAGLFRKSESSFFFSYDGLKLYSVVTFGTTQQNHFREYNLSSPFNLNTITFSNKYTVTGATSSSSRSIFFTRDGLNCYICQTQKRILRYSLSTAWDLSTLNLQNNVVFSSLYNNTTSNAGILVNDSGTKAILVDAANVSANPYQNSLLTYNLTTPHDLSTANLETNASARISNRTDVVFRNMFINDDENKLIVLYRISPTGFYRDIMNVYNLENNFSLLSATNTQISVPISQEIVSDIEISTSTRASYSFTNGKKYFRFFDVGSVSAGISSSDMTRYVRRKEILKNSHMSFSNTVDSIVTNDGKFVLVLKGGVSISPNNNLVNFHEMTTEYDIETTVTAYSRNVLRAAATENFYSLYISPTGNNIYVLYNYSGDIYIRKFESPTAYDFSTGVSSYSFNLNTIVPTNDFYGIFISSDGTKIYSYNVSNNKIYQFNTSTHWSINSLTVDSTSYTLSDFNGLQEKIAFSPDGTRIYISSESGTRRGITQFNLSTPWDITTMSSSKSGYCNLYSCVFGSNIVSNISFGENGKVLYHSYLNYSDKILFFSYRLSTPYELNSLKI